MERARFQAKGVTLHFLNDVFHLNLAFEPTQGILDRLALLQPITTFVTVFPARR